MPEDCRLKNGGIVGSTNQNKFCSAAAGSDAQETIRDWQSLACRKVQVCSYLRSQIVQWPPTLTY